MGSAGAAGAQEAPNTAIASTPVPTNIFLIVISSKVCGRHPGRRLPYDACGFSAVVFPPIPGRMAMKTNKLIGLGLATVLLAGLVGLPLRAADEPIDYASINLIKALGLN
jgi:hypothetical protein